jgi:serine-type D-Ala-D-Ala endopeptidase (penicillin-binding protein 7)
MGGTRGFMIQFRWLGVTALVCLCVSSLAQAGVSQGTVQRTHLKYSHRASLAEPSLRSSAALVLDTTHSSVLYSHRSDVAMPIASITKLMTALVVMDAGQPLGEVLVVSEADTLLSKASPSRLSPGTRLTRADFMHLALMSSENRAAHVLGSNYPGGVAACVKAMNEKARELGMTHAHFLEPTGLSEENVASPEDLSKLVMAAAKVPEIRQFSTDSGYEVSIGAHQLRFRNTDSLVSRPDWNILVQKTGYISEAGRCLVMQTMIGDRSVVIVLLNSFGKRTRIADARRVRRWLESSVLAREAHLAATT